MIIVEVLIEKANYSLDRPFYYLYEGDKKIEKGYRVLLEFNHQELVGYVLKVEKTNKSKEALEEELGFNLFYINDVIDNAPLLNDDLFALADQVADYYIAPKIAVLQSMLPPSLSPRKSSLKAPKIAYDQYVKVKYFDTTDLTAKQIELLTLIKDNEPVLKSEIKQVSILNKLLEHDLVEIVKVEKRRLNLPDIEEEKEVILSTEQNQVIYEFNNSNDSVYLLEGVTGSGKSEVYLTLSKQMLARGKSVLMLVPEISLTPMATRHFLARFKENVAILHSELTPAEKYDEYRKIARGEAKIVVGARSAIFAPLSNIGLIILDEEHVESYKQDVSPFYHAREVAIMRSKMHNAKVLLGSATPSLESRARAGKGVYHLLTLTKRINEQPLPKTTIINMGDYRNIDRDSYMFSLKLRDRLKNVLDNHNQAILLINRRGFATTCSCRHCGHIFKCPTCGIPLTYHKKENLLKCHHCDYMEVASETCPECGSKYIMRSGFGTERIEEEIHKLYPEARTLRLDSDSAKIRTKIPKVIEAFRNKEADILIGTQMIAKGHDFPDVTLVGIVLADIGLSMPSYRSSERAFQLITQAVGRSGRSDKVGEAIIQTYMPDHYAITMAARQDYELFYKKEMSMRKLQAFPPYTFLASVSISGKNEDVVIDTTLRLADQLNNEFKDKGIILGPTTPYISFEQDKHIRVILIKYKDQELARIILAKLIKSLINKSQISVAVNIDPYNF
ncbi:MAG: primosomal protein N' [Bacilli bacterium]|nr:primosomal protein N' [Bacilli bacterium]